MVYKEELQATVEELNTAKDDLAARAAAERGQPIGTLTSLPQRDEPTPKG